MRFEQQLDTEGDHSLLNYLFYKWMWLYWCMHPCLCSVFACVGGGQEGAQDRGTDVCCIVVVCTDGRGPGAAFVSSAFKSTRSHSVASCLPSHPSQHLPPPSSSSSWREGRDVCGGGGCLGLVEGAPAVPSAPPFLPHR